MKNISKKILAVALVISICMSIVACGKKKVDNPVGSVHMKVVHHDDVLYEGDIDIDNTSVYDLLEKAKLSYDMRKTALGTYVSSICDIAEKEEGAMSGWEYFINDVPGAVACDKCICSDKDNIMWKYAY